MVKSEKKNHQEYDPLAFLYTHRGVHYPCAMCPDGVGNVTDVDGVQVLIVTCLLNENLKKQKMHSDRNKYLV